MLSTFLITMTSRNGCRTAVLGVMCCLVFCGSLPAQTASSRLVREKERIFAKFQTSIQEARAGFHRKLEELARSCDQQQLTLEAEEIRQLARPLDPNVVQGKNLPRQVQLPIPRTLPEAERKWRQELRTLQTEYAQELFKKAKTAKDTGRISLAYDLVREVARHDPDHTFARRLLGYVRYQDEWVTFHQKKMLEQKYVLTDKFGWLKADQVERYENGERFYNSKWISAAKEAELRRNFKHAWIVKTDHYEIRTNHSLEMGVELGRHLEDFYRIFFQTFAGFLTKPSELNNLFNDGTTSEGTAAKKFVVHYYRTKQEYVETLKSALGPLIEGTSGLYLSGNRRLANRSIAHFFHNTDATEEERLATMFHEATHQLFSEAYTSNADVGVNSDFWVIEAIACYMESFQCSEETFSLGDPRYIRFQNAQYRVVEDNYYVPLQELSLMGQKAFQADPEISKNYSQGSGLAHFFMHYEDGIYRDAFIAYLSDIYSDLPKVRAAPRGLDVLTDVPFAKLDQQYRDYIGALKTGSEPEPQPAARQAGS